MFKDGEGQMNFTRSAFARRAAVVVLAASASDAMNAAAYRVRGFAHNMLNQNVDGAADTDKACALNKDFSL